MQTKSLAFRLITSSALWSLFVLGVAGVILSSHYRTSIEKSFDERLQIHMRALIAEVDIREDKSLRIEKGPGDSRFEVPYSGWYWQITNAQGGLSASSKSLFDAKLDVKNNGQGKKADVEFLYVSGPEGQNLRVISRPIILPETDTPFYFSVAGNAAEIENEVGSFVQILSIGLLTLALGMLLALFFQIKFGLRPLKRVQEALSDIRSGKEKELPGDTPSEISPLVTELNSLLKANRQVVERARTHVGNLAHSLKTPLSVLANEMSAVKPDDKKEKMSAQVDKMKNQISHHLDRAQMAARTKSFGLATDVFPVVDSIVRALNQINKARSLTVNIHKGKGVVFAGEKQDLEEIIGNILENAFKYAQSEITIGIEPVVKTGQASEEGTFIITISDDGPGLDEKDMKDALSRGKRLDESTPGSGLGLSIVSELIEIYEGHLTFLKSETGGLCVQITLPAAT